MNICMHSHRHGVLCRVQRDSLSAFGISQKEGLYEWCVRPSTMPPASENIKVCKDTLPAEGLSAAAFDCTSPLSTELFFVCAHRALLQIYTFGLWL